MRKGLQALMFMLAGTLALAVILSCDRDTETTEEAEPIKFVSANPPSGSTLRSEATLSVLFDGIPKNLTVSPGVAMVSGQTATISGPFPLGELRLSLTWADGTHTLVYTVEPPPAPEGMVLIPAGEFLMGSNDGRSNEQPVHTVHVDAFYMDKYEVTNLDYKRFVLANPQWQKGRIPGSLHNGNYLKHWTGNNYPAGKANHPVTFVSWYAAVAYSKWVGKRLPTEAEWEKAARGGLSGMKYPWGNTISSVRANYGSHVGDTTVVGAYPANGYGLHDMAGNVWEWCLDAYNADFYFSSPGANPLSDVNTLSNVNLILDDYTNVKSSRVLRGGTWYYHAMYVRCASRFSRTPTNSREFKVGGHLGFRCARAVSP